MCLFVYLCVLLCCWVGVLFCVFVCFARLSVLLLGGVVRVCVCLFVCVSVYLYVCAVVCLFVCMLTC